MPKEEKILNKPTFLHAIYFGLIFLFFFAIFHFLYTLFPSPITRVLGGVDESIFQHMKMGVLAFIVVSVLEMIILKKRITNYAQFSFSRLLACTILPWVIFVLWYSVPTLLGHPLSPLAIELSYSLVITFIVGVVCIKLAWDFEQIHFSMFSKVLIIIMFVILIYLLVSFSLITPIENFFRTI
jgi:hypothetical protein